MKIDRDCACVQYFNSFFTYRKTWLYLNRSNNLPIILIWDLKTIIMIVLCCIICHFQFCFYSLSLSALNHQINFRPFSTKFQFHTSSLDSLNLRNWSLVFPNFMPCYFPHMEKVRTKKIRLFDSRILTLFRPETSDNGKKGGDLLFSEVHFKGLWHYICTFSNSGLIIIP